jgi:protein-S-isoprenylcysteine O-methyltransferase Ste14
MLDLNTLTIALFAIWCITELLINLISFHNRSSVSDRVDRLSYLAVWFSIMLPVGFAMLVWKHTIFTSGFGSLAILFPLLGYLGCVLIILGVTVRVVAVITLGRQFTTKVTIIQKHEIVDTGIYRFIRHPAYLGLLMSLLGIGLVSGNLISLLMLTILPLASAVYRIHIEEVALSGHFGAAYQEYMNRTKRLLPGVW